jgi:Protein of unknown function (DUF2806)
MPDNPSQITIAGDWSKPATTLIEKIADAVGGIARPYQIVRVAKADAEAEKIRARGQVEVNKLQHRAMRRFLAEEAKKQANMEQIIRDALPQLREDAKPENVEDDWITNFFEKARIISDEQMQQLWSKILAAEANSPRTYSRQTVNILSDLDKADAELFTKACSFGWTFLDPVPRSMLLILDPRHAVYKSNGIFFDARAGFTRNPLPSTVRAEYCGRTLTLTIPEPPHNSMSVGKVILTRAGDQIASVCGISPVDGFFEYIQETWQRASYLAGVPKPTESAPGNKPAEP